jgi:hypothetical protein
MSLSFDSQEPIPVAMPEKEPPARMPAAGPHARADLTNFDACPGSGVLPSEQELTGETDPGAG